MNAWTQPKIGGGIDPPKVEDVMKYLAAYYHGLPVKQFEPRALSYTNWPKDRPSRVKIPRSIGLDTPNKNIRIRSRPSLDTLFPVQLHLDDLLDVATNILPSDAYALLLLVNHDTYEEDKDDFVCGIACGRIAVVSLARYCPGLDKIQRVERVHAWPASHCEDFVRQYCESDKGSKSKKRKREDILAKVQSSATQGHNPMQAAISAHNALPSLETTNLSEPSPALLTGLWLGRLCRTASHELGHCFGINHCIYYACSMQGSATIIEDTRQPPYLCPVDLEKVVKATGTGRVERYNALREVCGMWKGVQYFETFDAWIKGRLEEMIRLGIGST